MKQFDLKEYLANPSRKVVTRAGNSVRILCTDRKGDYSIIALVENCDSTEESLYTYTKDGYCGYASSDNDNLFFAPEKGTGYVAVSKVGEFSRCVSGIVFDTPKEVKNATRDYIAIAKIEWEE